MTTSTACRPQALVQPLHHTFEEATALVDAAIAETKRCTAIVNDAVKFPRNGIGLVSDAVRFSPEYRNAMKDLDHAFSIERNLNAWYIKQYGKQVREYREARRQAKLQASQIAG